MLLHVKDTVWGQANLAASCVALSPDGALVATSKRYGCRVRLFNTETGELVHVLEYHKRYVTALAITEDGKTLVSASLDPRADVCAWSLEGEQAPPQPTKVFADKKGHSDAVIAVAVSADGRLLATGGRDKRVCVWRLDEGRFEQRLEAHAAPVRTLAFSGDGKTLVSGAEDGAAVVWRHDRSWMLRTNVKDAHAGPVHSVALSADGRSFFSAGADSLIRKWSVEGEELARLRGHTDAVLSIAVFPDGLRVFSSSRDKSVLEWAAPRPWAIALIARAIGGRPAPLQQASKRTKADFAASLCLSKNTNLLAEVEEGGKVTLTWLTARKDGVTQRDIPYNPATRAPVRSPSPPQAPVRSAAPAPVPPPPAVAPAHTPAPPPAETPPQSASAAADAASVSAAPAAVASPAPLPAEPEAAPASAGRPAPIEPPSAAPTPGPSSTGVAAAAAAALGAAMGGLGARIKGLQLFRGGSGVGKQAGAPAPAPEPLESQQRASASTPASGASENAKEGPAEPSPPESSSPAPEFSSPAPPMASSPLPVPSSSMPEPSSPTPELSSQDPASESRIRSPGPGPISPAPQCTAAGGAETAAHATLLTATSDPGLGAKVRGLLLRGDSRKQQEGAAGPSPEAAERDATPSAPQQAEKKGAGAPDESEAPVTAASKEKAGTVAEMNGQRNEAPAPAPAHGVPTAGTSGGGEKKWDAFISYSRKDSDLVYQYADALRGAGFAIWIDKELKAGQYWDDTLKFEIGRSRAIVCFLSPNYIASDIGGGELEFAMAELKLPTFPVYLAALAATELPLRLYKLTKIQCIQQREAGPAAVAAAVRELVDGLRAFGLPG